ncbi:MAG: flagellar biosynthesis protein FlhA [Deltaproteobacteria bacterium]|nr:flagellar biosynthesis protein FlhA [Deltaproteobacteria bacterium]MCB9488998.1 flagellar biosynthesis protein FlhA [Deltaproteobacteria bacterium]
MSDEALPAAKSPAVVLAAVMVGILFVMILPIPTFLLDALLTLSITLGIFILLVALNAGSPLEFSSFPSLLLVATLFRLSLNVCSTRLILLHGNEGSSAAGKVIEAFGMFVVGGNYVVGVIVFTVLVVINFVVITKGSGRIAEVAARFTLDAMPGKQMAIDADMNSGLIDEQTARKRRKEIENQADFYGAMDGASKFVRGDAVAGIVITLVNVIGGFVIGVAQQKMALGEAASVYTILSVGDGLVSQIPALIISTAAGIVVTRAAGDSDLAGSIVGQLFGKSRIFFFTAAILGFFAIVPGMPAAPFFLLALAAFLYAMRLRGTETIQAQQEEEQKQIEGQVEAPPERMEDLLEMDLIELEIGYGLIHLVDKEQGGELLEKVKAIRRQVAQKIGMIVPPIHIRDNLQLKPGQYRILIKGVEIGSGELMNDRFLAMDAGTVDKPINGIPTTEPAFGLPALWINKKDAEKARFSGYTVVDLATVITTHLSEIFRVHAHELLSRQDVSELLENFGKKYPKVVSELVPNLLSLGGVQKVLQNLVKEEIPVRDMLTILEALADHASVTKDPDILTEYVRQALARTVTDMHVNKDGTLALVTLDASLEHRLTESVQSAGNTSYLNLDPETAQRMIQSLEASMGRFSNMGLRPILLTNPVVRGHLKRFLEKFLPSWVILSHNEIHAKAKIYSLGTVEL